MSHRHTLLVLTLVGCGGGSETTPPVAKDPVTTAAATIDRFSDQAGMLMRRSASPMLPAPNAPIDFDQAPFITTGFGPAGNSVDYYNFDVQPTVPAPIFVFFRPGASDPVPGQLNVIDVIPGDVGYNDFWQVQKVTVPASYVANSVTSRAGIVAAGFAVAPTTMLVNCPVVPVGSRATLRLACESAELQTGWYRDMVVHYFSFGEKALAGTTVPISPIFVTFNINPTDAGGGPGSGFRTETPSAQTHNVIAALPSEAAYSPLWSVNVYDNAAFAQVKDLASARAAPQLAAGVATVNCPVVRIR